jgi:hypothetical protein
MNVVPKNHFEIVDQPLEAVHCELVGPITPSTNAGKRYFLTMVDQFSGFIFVAILKEKSNTLKKDNRI